MLLAYLGLKIIPLWHINNVVTIQGMQLHTKKTYFHLALARKSLGKFRVTLLFIFFSKHCLLLGGRRSGLMVSALVPEASGPGSSPDRGHCVVFLGKTLNFHSASLFTQEYKWVPAKCWGNLTNCWEVTCDGPNIPSRGSTITVQQWARQAAMSQTAPRLHFFYLLLDPNTQICYFMFALEINCKP